MAMITYRDVTQTANCASGNSNSQHNSFTICVPLSTPDISQAQTDEKHTAQSGCVSRYAVIAIEQQQIITVAMCAAWAALPQPCAIAIVRSCVRSEELLEKSYFACLSDDAMMFLEATETTFIFDVDDDA